MLTLLSPAKINLFLRIVRRRDDGYHDLASLFQAINLYDTLHFSPSSADKLTCTDLLLPTDERNLISKARSLFRRKTGINTPIVIHVEKQIPQQAGLGGGSSNAATTLWAMNQFFGVPATDSELAQWGAEIGSDISFFLSRGTAYCTGRGEIIRELSPLPLQKITIVKPPQGLSTPEVFRNLKCDSLLQRDPEMVLNQFFHGHPSYFNDLEEPAFQVLPSLRTLKSQLQQNGFSTVLMSGAGSSLFCLGDGKVPQDLWSESVVFANRTENRETGNFNWYS